ncbi:MAG: hypothetical protein AAFO79_01710 [Pseudomonadota bacterium]
MRGASNIVVPPGTVWGFRDTEALAAGAYRFRWCGTYEQCDGASRPLPFCSPWLAFEVVK